MESHDFTNLRQHRSEVDAWTRRWSGYRAADERIVLSAATVASIALVLYGARRRRSDSGMWWLVSGAAVGCAAVSLGIGQWLRNSRFGTESSSADVVTQESVDSFPASDAPSSNATTATAQPFRN
jgi:hypothetical protein